VFSGDGGTIRQSSANRLTERAGAFVPSHRDATTLLAANVERVTRIAAADAFRALAIFTVVAYHVLQKAQPILQGPQGFAELGVWGVDCFFVLSGFLLGGEYFRRLLAREIVLQSPLQFWLKRFLRIVPLYVACMLLSIVIDRIALHGSPSGRDAIIHLLFLQDFDASKATTINGPYWTMPVDIEFYLLLPLYGAIMATIFRRYPTTDRLPAIAASLACITIVGILFRYYEVRYNPSALRSFADEVVWVRNVIGLASAFCLGCALALIASRQLRPKPAISYAILAFAVVCEFFVMLMTSPESEVISTDIVLNQTLFDLVGGLSAVAVLFVMIHGKLPFIEQIITSRAVAQAASLAYGVYLIHYPVLQFVAPYFGHFGSIVRVLGIGIATIIPTLAVSFILHRAVEQPFLNIKSSIRN
jgi:peptidoglycan/LPS O-acetylase OafA/YrhL